MGTTIDFIRQAAPVEWLLSPAVLAAAVVLFLVVLSGLPGRIILEVESMAQVRRSQRL